jgi:hypothetical protein
MASDLPKPNPKKRGRQPSNDDGEQDREVVLTEPPKKKKAVEAIDLELTIGDLFSQAEVDEFKASFSRAKAETREWVVKPSKQFWDGYAKYRKLASETPQVLLNMTRDASMQTFFGERWATYYNIDRHETVPIALLKQLSSRLATHLDIPPDQVAMIVFNATQADPNQPLCSTEVLVDRCISKRRTADAFEVAWAVEPFLEKCLSLVKGGGKFNWCKGLIPLLRNHLMWQMNPECDALITSIEQLIQTHQTKGPHFYDTQAIKSRLNTAFKFVDDNTVFSHAARTPQHLNAGRWIRL